MKVGKYYGNLDIKWVIFVVVINLFNCIHIDVFMNKMLDTISGKSKADEGKQNSGLIQIISKFNELKQDLITEIKSLIQLEIKKVVKKQKEEFNVTVLKLQ